MTIHHATVKAAAAKGVILSFDPDAETVTAHFAELNLRVSFDAEEHGTVTDTARQAFNDVLEIKGFHEENPGIGIVQEDGDFCAYHFKGGKVKGEEFARDPVLEDLFETIKENGVDDEDEDEETTGSVVPAKYKREYAERGDPNNCGDWLALTLAKLCRVLEDGKEVTDLDRLETIANANDVAPARWGKLGIATNGWQGRFRMTIRNMLTPRIAAKGFLFVPEGCGVNSDTEMKAPKEWCAAHSPKPKAKTASPKAAVKKNEGAGKASAKTKTKARLDGVAAATAAVKASKAKEAARKIAHK